MKKAWNIFLVLPLMIILLSCEDELIQEQQVLSQDELAQLEKTNELKQAVFDIMSEWYLWNDLIPEVDIDSYTSAEDLMRAMTNKQLDKWSYIENEEEYDALFEKGEYEGYGFRMAFDPKGNLRVAFVYNDSPFGRAGVQRSWIINKINGKAVKDLSSAALAEALEGSTHNFEMIRSDGITVSELVTKTTIGINTVLTDKVFDLENTKVGYLAFNSFLATSEEELKSSFQKFKDANIQELIIDLRYNGGGRVNIAEWMASNIIGNLGNGRNFLEYKFNKDKSEENDSQVAFQASEIPLNLDRVVFITSSGSASASELLINGLLPFIDVSLIGDNTYGKPVGSFKIPFEGYAINPISFKVLNDQGIGEYFEGIPADAYVEDDLTHDLGNPEESRLKEALYYIQNGSFSGLNARQSNSLQSRQFELEGFRQEIGAF
ncbi:S41 family peptidase [Catalinimonas niigatensis]|uniref:S41 family peptidase n=1 Tax=Catalinimonas niigatensis TaxID=1397264 RepID=UPI00266505B5|nr:S41 family peptidase [Catalinimonas niigatensis]WPP50647.1 S41 family peptidase [Catalinimonas niigatensis]